MQASELRIGNLVQTKHAKSNYQITAKDILDISQGRFPIDPIPLTEEWLVKLGFEKTYESAFRLKYDLPCNFIGFDFSKTEDKSMDGLRFYGRYFKIKYVHQLQNLYFALTGEELVCQ